MRPIGTSCFGIVREVFVSRINILQIALFSIFEIIERQNNLCNQFTGYRALCAQERKISMNQKNNGRIGNLPANINIMNPVPNKDAKNITKLVRKNGKISGYELSDGTVLSKREGVALAKQGGIRGVAIASRNGSEYLRSLPDGNESNNLGDLPSAPADDIRM